MIQRGWKVHKTYEIWTCLALVRSFDRHKSATVSSTLTSLLQSLFLNIGPFIGQLIPWLARSELLAVLLVDGLQTAHFTWIACPGINNEKGTWRERFIYTRDIGDSSGDSVSQNVRLRKICRVPIARGCGRCGFFGRREKGRGLVGVVWVRQAAAPTTKIFEITNASPGKVNTTCWNGGIGLVEIGRAHV